MFPFISSQLYEAYSSVCRKQQVAAVDQSECLSLSGLLESRGILGLKKNKESRLTKVQLMAFVCVCACACLAACARVEARDLSVLVVLLNYSPSWRVRQLCQPASPGTCCPCPHSPVSTDTCRNSRFHVRSGELNLDLHAYRAST